MYRDPINVKENPFNSSGSSYPSNFIKELSIEPKQINGRNKVHIAC